MATLRGNTRSLQTSGAGAYHHNALGHTGRGHLPLIQRLLAAERVNHAADTGILGAAGGHANAALHATGAAEQLGQASLAHLGGKLRVGKRLTPETHQVGIAFEQDALCHSRIIHAPHHANRNADCPADALGIGGVEPGFSVVGVDDGTALCCAKAHVE